MKMSGNGKQTSVYKLILNQFCYTKDFVRNILHTDNATEKIQYFYR